MARPDPLRDPVRDPRCASAPERTRRAAILLLLTALVPGGAQVVAGNRRWGRLILRVTLTVWAAILVALLWAAFSRGSLLNMLASDGALAVLSGVLVALAVGWAVVWVDTFRLIRLHLLAPGARLITSAATVLVLVLTTGGLLYGGWAAHVGRGSLGDVFGDGPALEVAEGRYNILVMGGDAGEGRAGLRPDSIHVASVDARTGAITMFSLPRNIQNAQFTEDSPLWTVYPTGFDCGDECILNALYVDVEENHPDLYPGAEHPGAEAMMDAAGGILGLDVTGYALMDMGGFEQLIDAMGGVDIISGGYVTHRGTRPDGTWGNAWWAPGRHHFDGADALAFARSRHWATDYSRIRRQQCMQAAMLRQFTPATVLTRFEEILQAGTQIVTTNMPQSQLGTFVDLAERSRGYEMRRLTIGAPDFGTAADKFSTHPDFDLVHARVQELLDQEPSPQAAGIGADTALAGPGTGFSALPLLTAATPSPSASTGGPSTWPDPPTRPDGQPFTLEDLMHAEDAGQEDVLIHASSTNDLCAPAR
ncbi:LCP family protein [Micrococcus sp.]|uniref:LCP family glycopolymer transferase n=1 Tax=Micrococcus sp. TaxID=1271 RepID=UPI002A9110A8|nr:LCP family protein [Micrococcus sp.]MDY6055347.1 LCP family protein [Micrococcus sp.]